MGCIYIASNLITNAYKVEDISTDSFFTHRRLVDLNIDASLQPGKYKI